MTRVRAILIWSVLAAVIVMPIALAAASPLLAWRDPIYIAAGFAGVIAMAALVVQPLLVGGGLPGVAARLGRRVHRIVGSVLVLAVVMHVAGLWLTSPPDVVDALLFVSPTPFSAWGVVAMWAVFGAALLALLRKRWGLRPRTWRVGHAALAIVTVLGSVVHAMLIEGTMETLSKTLLCAVAVLMTIKTIVDLRIWARRAMSR